MIVVGVDGFWKLYDDKCEKLLEYIRSTYSGHYVGPASGSKGQRFQVFDYYETLVIADKAYLANVLKYSLRLGKKDGWNRKDIYKAAHYAVLVLGGRLNDYASSLDFNEDVAIQHLLKSDRLLDSREIQSFCYLATTDGIWGWLMGEIVFQASRITAAPGNENTAAYLAHLLILAIMWFEASEKDMSVHEAVEAHARRDSEPAQAPNGAGAAPGFGATDDGRLPVGVYRG